MPIREKLYNQTETVKQTGLENTTGGLSGGLGLGSSFLTPAEGLSKLSFEIKIKSKQKKKQVEKNVRGLQNI